MRAACYTIFPSLPFLSDCPLPYSVAPIKEQEMKPYILLSKGWSEDMHDTDRCPLKKESPAGHKPELAGHVRTRDFSGCSLLSLLFSLELKILAL